MFDKDETLREMLGTCRAIHFAMRHHQLTYEEAKLKTSPILKKINSRLELLAKKHGVKPQRISFYSLGSNL
jgi:hypothetical protein